MDIRYQIITSTEEKARLFRFRKQVFVDEEKRWKTDQDHITDLFDCLEETVNLAAMAGDRMIAALRVTPETAAGFPVDRHWDSTSVRRELGGGFVNMGWLCCTADFRGRPGLIKGLIVKGAEQARIMGARYYLSVIHPPLYDLLHHCFGTWKIGEVFTDSHLGVDMIPICGDVDEALFRYPDQVGKDQLVLSEASAGTDTHQSMSGLGFRSRYQYLEQALSRNIGILSASELERLGRLRVAIPGLGGVGGQHLISLARTGIGRFSLAEFDTFEAVNTNRQYGARVSTLNRPKLEVMVEDVLDINPFLDIRSFPEGVTRENIDDFLDGVDLVADGMDFFNIEIRRLIFTRARQRQIPVVTAGPLGFSAALLVFMPDRGMDFDTYFNIRDTQTREEMLLRFFVGLAPKASQAAYIDPGSISMAGERGPSTGAGCLMCSGVLAAEAVRILLKKEGVRPVPHYFQYDPFVRRFHTGILHLGNRHPLQRYKIWRIGRAMARALPRDLPEAPPSENRRQIMNHLINAGCQAPSGDNSQPWRFELRDNRIDLFLRPGADTSFFNLNQMASVMACGAAIENICQVGTRYGLTARPEILPDPENEDQISRISFDRTGVEESALARFVWSRHTCRTRFSGRPVPDGDVALLEKGMTAFPDCRLILIRDRKSITAVSRLIYQADLLRSQRRDLHTHLMKMIRFSREAALATRDGLPLKNLEAGRAGELFLKTCRPWSVMEGANRLGLGRMVANAALKGARQSSALGLITVRGSGRPAWITGGRALERFWLTASAAGLGFQPMTALTLFRARWEAGQRSDYSLDHQQLLGRLWPVFDHYFPMDQEECPVMLFRLGYGKPVSCRTLRRYQGTCG